MNLFEEIKNDVAGLATVREMFGENNAPVSPSKSAERAAICVTCPMNAPIGNWWEMAKTKMAETIKRHLEMKKHLLLETPHDDQLHTCKVCSCVLSLKTHVPTETLKHHTDINDIPRFPAYCWVRHELENL